MLATDVDPRIETVLRALDDHDADTAASQFTADGTYYEMPRDEAFTRAEFRQYLAEELFVTFPDYGVDDSTVFTAADWATTLQWTFSGTHEGDVGWFDPTGQTITLPVVSVVTVTEAGIRT